MPRSSRSASTLPVVSPFAGQSDGVAELRRLGRSLVEHVLVLLVVADDDAGLEEVLAEDDA